MTSEPAGEADEGGHVLAVRRNCSLSAGGALLFFGGIATVSLVVAGVLAWQGFWPVLPFAGLELFVLGIALGLSWRSGQYREVIRVEAHEVTVERGWRRRREKIVFPRPWTRVTRLAPAHAWYPSRLVISAHGRGCEVGSGLTENERSGLQQRLGELLAVEAGPPAGAPGAQN